MGLREKLIALLRSNHTLLETAAVSATSLLRLADLLIEHGVIIPVRCKDCKNYEAGMFAGIMVGAGNGVRR